MEKTNYEQLSTPQKQIYEKIEDILIRHSWDDGYTETLEELFTYVDQKIKEALCSTIF